jgi:hypothetical protein
LLSVSNRFVAGLILDGILKFFVWNSMNQLVHQSSGVDLRIRRIFVVLDLTMTANYPSLDMDNFRTRMEVLIRYYDL